MVVISVCVKIVFMGRVMGEGVRRSKNRARKFIVSNVR
jgi:hypothetical protein